MHVPGPVLIPTALMLFALSACGGTNDTATDTPTLAATDEATAGPLSGITSAETTSAETTGAATPAEAGAASETDMAAATPAGDLSAYVGKFPFDKVNGVPWNDNPVVAAGIAKTVTDAAARKAITQMSGPSSAIALYQGKVASWACQQHNCGDHQWNVMVDPKSGATDVCYYNAEQLQDNSRWFLSTGKVETRAGNCSVT